uniref:Uncharacterized protein n=1 Tax=Eptatretus burgeri TaxID=7764 RepID=A0A8C4N806_EPTBU
MDLGGPPFPGASTALTGEVLRELDLQTLFSDERVRCHRHKMNYQNIKEELSRFCVFCLNQNGLRIQLSCLAQVKPTVFRKPGGHGVESRMVCMQDCDFYRNEFNKVRYESTLLKAEFDHQQKQQTQLLEENRLKHQAEITQINEECQELRSRLSTGAAAQEKRRADALESEKVRLGQRMTSLEVELAEIRARADDARNRAESERRTLAQQLTDTQAALSIAEVRPLSKEESKCREQNLQLSTKLRSAERDIGAQLAKMEELKHVHRREVTSIRLEAAQCRTQLEQEKDDVQDQLEGL